MLGLGYQDILNSIQVWGYPLMFLLMIAEGPIVTLGAAFLASMGFFNVWIVLALSILGDIIADVVLYYIGFFSKHGLSKSSWFLRKNPSGILESVKNAFHKRGAQIIFFTKATTGLCYATFITAGALKINIKKFLIFSTLGGVVWSGFIVILGYFFGKIAEEIEQYIKYSGWVIFLFAVSIITLVVIYKKTAAIKEYGKNLNFKNKK